MPHDPLPIDVANHVPILPFVLDEDRFGPREVQRQALRA